MSLPATDLSGKTALITGTTSGFGRRMAAVLAKAGANVALTGRRVDRLDEARKEVEAIGVKTTAIALDVTDIESIRACVEQTEKDLGPIDILVNNAGMNNDMKAVDFTPEAYDQVMNTNLRGAYFMATEVARRMIAAKRPGRIINISSIGGLRVLPGLSVYCMSKAAMLMMTQSLAREWARKEINVTAICPGFIETELNAYWFETEAGQKQIASYPRKRLGEESDLDGALLLLAGDQSRIITGSHIVVDDGQSI